MIHQQEKLELLTQQTEIANSLLENKLLSREWIYENIFDLNDGDKKKIFDGIIEDRKQAFRFEQIEQEGNDPGESDESFGTPHDLAVLSMQGEQGRGQGVEGNPMARKGDWGGDRRSGTEEKEYGNEYDSDDLKDATKYEKEKYGKREFKGKSPLATSKGGTIVAREGLLNSLKDKFGKKLDNQSILNEEIILDEDE
tara:strand:- start:956 stop:1546 length:591 start_codon:yes stop_codon:yes gene_type:complete